MKRLFYSLSLLGAAAFSSGFSSNSFAVCDEALVLATGASAYTYAGGLGDCNDNSQYNLSSANTNSSFSGVESSAIGYHYYIENGQGVPFDVDVSASSYAKASVNGLSVSGSSTKIDSVHSGGG